jgi:creatinine amidohydrolase
VAAVLAWAECTRDELTRVLPEALVVLPVGAIEQHGPHLPVCTDTLIVTGITRAAVDAASDGCPRDLVLAPTMCFGASDHHLPFGGTLSLSAEVMTSALLDLARSVARSGASRLLFANGHGGNRGPCHSAAMAASTRHDIAVAYLDYWELLDDSAEGPPIPGHAGAFETSLVGHLRDAIPQSTPRPDSPSSPAVADVTLYRQRSWETIAGHTDDPSLASAQNGRAWFERCVNRLAGRIRQLAEQL